MHKILAINPGSTSTKITVYEDDELLFTTTLKHSNEDLKDFKKIIDQKDYRHDMIQKALVDNGIELKDLNAIVARGGLLRPLKSGGTYSVNEVMVNDLVIAINGEHASNLGAIIADSFARELNIPAYIVDPTIIDELNDIARYSGIPELPRLSKFHALNQKAVARAYANSIGKKYEEVNVVVAHMGGGISIGAHQKGRVIDVNNALDGDGPFTPERSGTIAPGDLVKLCYSGKYSFEEMYKKIVGKAGLVAYTGTHSFQDIINKDDEKSKEIVEAFAYDIAKNIGYYAVSLKGDIDAIILTGGIAHNKEFTDLIGGYVKFIAPIVVFPGENEMLALTKGALRVLRGEEEAKEYI